MRVDLINDLQVPRQEAAEDGERPSLQRLGQQGVIRVGERLARDAPRIGPRQDVFIDQQPHEFGDGDGRMGVVELHREFLVKFLDRQFLPLDDAEHVLQGT